MKAILCITFFACNLLTGAESPVREAEPPYPLIPKPYSLETYDANGNLTRQRDNTKDLTKRISVDSQDRITQIQDGNNSTVGSYWYDDGGFRIRKSSLEQKNNVFANVEILYPNKFFGLEFIEVENVISSVNNVFLNGVRIAALNEVGALAYFLTDQVDSVSHVLDDEGNSLSQIQFQPYGETFVQRGDSNFAPKFNSQELDRESGFFFFNARFYDPAIARFTSADTVIDGEFDTQGWNRFSFVKGNPIGAKDPTGHCLTQGMRSFFAATCSNASVQADKATHQDVNNRVNYQNNSSFLKTATVVNGLAKGTPTSAGITLAMKAAEKIPGVKEGGEKLNAKLYGDNPKVAELKNFGVLLGSTMVGMGTASLGNSINQGLKSTATKNVNLGNGNYNISKNIHTGQQGKHVVGHNNYNPLLGKSILKEDAQSLLDNFHSGKINNYETIQPNKVRVDFGKNIGDYINPNTKTSAPTTNGIITSGKNGAHIYPSRPNQ